MAAVFGLRALARRGGLAARAGGRSFSDVEAEMAADAPKIAATIARRQKSVTAPHVAVVPDGLAPAVPENVAEVAALSSQPPLHKGRTVVISQMAQNAMGSSSGATKAWRLSWKTEERWTNPLMGWTSTGDPLGNAELKFETADAARFFAAKQGWACEVAAGAERDKRYGTNTYSHNFLQKAVEADLKKNGTETTNFRKEKPDASHYFRPLKFHGDGECRQHGHDGEKEWKYAGSPDTPWEKSPTSDPATPWEPFAAADPAKKKKKKGRAAKKK